MTKFKYLSSMKRQQLCCFGCLLSEDSLKANVVVSTVRNLKPGLHTLVGEDEETKKPRRIRVHIPDALSNQGDKTVLFNQEFDLA